MNQIIVVFLDGVGLGAASTGANPFMHVSLTTARELLGVDYLTGEVAGTVTAQAALLGLDARLGVDGLPQSGTGQTAILTGQNAPQHIGEHYGPYPNPVLRQMLATESIFVRLRQQGEPVAYANAYPHRFIDRVARGKGRMSANTLAAVQAGLTIRSTDDLLAGQAIPALIRTDYWPEPEVTLPPCPPAEMGGQLVRLARDFRLTFFEFWYTDVLGHKQRRQESIEFLHTLDAFIMGVIANLTTNMLLLVISDHGNFEDWTTRKHTLNPALSLVAGAGSETVAARLHSLIDINGAVWHYLFDYISG